LEYLKCCHLLRQQEYKLRPSSLHCIPSIVLKIQELLNNNSFDSQSSSSSSCSTAAALTLEFWIKGLEVLRRLLLADEHDRYFHSLYSWIITQLLEQNVVDPLLLECISTREMKDYYRALSILVKYYLPKHHSLVDEAFSFSTGSLEEMGSRREIFKKILSSPFIPIDKFHDISLGPFLIPVLQAFQKGLSGLQQEWKYWIENSESPYHLHFPHSGLLLRSVDDDLPEPYSEWDISMICDRILGNYDNSVLFFCRSDHSLTSKIQLQTRMFLSGSIELLGTNGDEPLLSRNCLNVALLYLKFIEVNRLPPENKIFELERIFSELQQLINQHPRIKKGVEAEEKKREEEQSHFSGDY
jgi:hypothetical protein